MVRSISILAMCITLFISLLLPMILLIFYGMKNQKMGVVSAWFFGAAGFFIPQMLIRIPILSFLGSEEWFVSFAEGHYLIYAIILAFTAALFEVIGRYVVAKLLMNKSKLGLNYTRAAAAGLGHGGIEAMFLIGITYINNLIYSFMINAGLMEGIIQQTEAMGADVSSVRTAVDALISTSPYLFAAAGLERILTMIGHLAMSLLVCYFVWKKQDVKGILICLMLHTILDGVSAVLNGLSTPYLGEIISTNTGYILVYGFLGVMAILFGMIIVKIKGAWKE